MFALIHIVLQSSGSFTGSHSSTLKDSTDSGRIKLSDRGVVQTRNRAWGLVGKGFSVLYCWAEVAGAAGTKCLCIGAHCCDMKLHSWDRCAYPGSYAGSVSSAGPSVLSLHAQKGKDAKLKCPDCGSPVLGIGCSSPEDQSGATYSLIK
eukprot:3927800-Rhodomonas_salina.1